MPEMGNKVVRFSNLKSIGQHRELSATKVFGSISTAFVIDTIPGMLRCSCLLSA